MAHWYNRVVADLSEITNCIDHYETVYEQAIREVKLMGHLETASKELPGITAQRYGELQEQEAILEFLNIQLRKLRSQVFRKFLENYPRQLSSRDAEKYVDGDPDVVSMTELVNTFSLIRNKWLAIHKGLESKSFQLNNIVKLRAAGLDDADVG